MSNVFIPLGGTGGKNRGTAAVLGDDTPFINSGSEMSLPLPAGVYKKSKSNPRADYGDGKNAEVTISVGLEVLVCAFPIDMESVALAVGTDTFWEYGAEEDQLLADKMTVTSFVLANDRIGFKVLSSLSIFSLSFSISIKSVLSGLFSFKLSV